MGLLDLIAHFSGLPSPQDSPFPAAARRAGLPGHLIKDDALWAHSRFMLFEGAYLADCTEIGPHWEMTRWGGMTDPCFVPYAVSDADALGLYFVPQRPERPIVAWSHETHELTWLAESALHLEAMLKDVARRDLDEEADALPAETFAGLRGTLRPELEDRLAGEDDGSEERRLVLPLLEKCFDAPSPEALSALEALYRRDGWVWHEAVVRHALR